jgi:hypothetical protein
MSNSDPISLENMPELPKVGYYDTHAKLGNSYTILTDILTKNCTKGGAGWSGQSGIYNTADFGDNYLTTFPNIQTPIPEYCSKLNSIITEKDTTTDLYKQQKVSYDVLTEKCNDIKTHQLPKIDVDQNISSLDIPYYLSTNQNLIGTLPIVVERACGAGANGTAKITNQINYLTCQLAQERNRKFDSNNFNAIGGMNIKQIFEKTGKMKVIFVGLFILTMYFCTAGFFGSMDLASNIFTLIEKNGDTTNITYWVGIIVGIIVPIIVLCVLYKKIICKNLDELDNFDITHDPYGVKHNSSGSNSSAKNFDIGILVLFIFLIFAFIASLFTIKRAVFGDLLYSIIIGLILSIISVFLYIMYAFIPFFDSAETKDIGKHTEKLRLFVDTQDDVTNITTNQTQDKNVKKTFGITAILIIVLGILFFALQKSNPFVNGFLSSSAILILPILWVFNFVIAINYFYIYPIILIVVRFIRYIIMSLLYIASSKNSSLKDKFSDDLVEQLDNFKNYSSPWGMIFVDEMKLILNVLGYENKFSKQIIGDDNSKNISQNKFASSFMLGFLINFIVTKDKSNMSGIIYSVLVIFIAVIISIIILYGIIKI